MEVLDYIQSCAPASVDRFFKDSFACVAVFRSLPPLSQQLVLRMLELGETTNAFLKQWSKQGASQAVQSAVDQLCNLRIFVRKTGSQGWVS